MSQDDKTPNAVSSSSSSRLPIMARTSPEDTRGLTPSDDFQRLMPGGSLLLFLLLPPLTSFVFDEDSLHWTLQDALQSTAGSTIPFVCIPAALYGAYRWFMPGLLVRLRTDRQRVALHVVACALISGTVALLVAPVCRVVNPEMVAKGDLKFAMICVAIGLFLCVPTVLLQYSKNREQRLRAAEAAHRKAVLEAELRALQSRTNPHFLFNSLNTVASLIPDDPTLAEDTLVKLSDLFRYALDSSRASWVSLERELAMVADYLDVQELRFGARLAWEIDVEAGIDPAQERIPPLTLQPLIENSVLHGGQGREPLRVLVSVDRLEPDEAPHSSLARPAASGIRISITDDGAGTPGPHAGSGTSSADLRHRLSLVYGRDDLLESGPLEGGGYRARVTLPGLEQGAVGDA